MAFQGLPAGDGDLDGRSHMTNFTRPACQTQHPAPHCTPALSHGKATHSPSLSLTQMVCSPSSPAGREMDVSSLLDAALDDWRFSQVRRAKHLLLLPTAVNAPPARIDSLPLPTPCCRPPKQPSRWQRTATWWHG